MRSHLHTAPGMGRCEEGFCMYPGVGWCSSEGLNTWPRWTRALEQQPWATIGLIMSCAWCFRAR